jgi:hypothetical protein
VETIRNCFCHGGFKTDDKTDDEHEHSLPEKPVDLSDEVYGDWVDVDSHLDVASATSISKISKKFQISKISSFKQKKRFVMR